MNQTEALNVADEMSDHDAGPIYLDHQATTPLAPSVLDAMLPFFETHYGNPHSLQHPYGVDAATAIEDAREHIAQLLGVRAAEIYFMSGATESNNIVLQGIAAQADQHHIVSCATEHPSVLNVLNILAERGARVSLIDVQSDGRIDLVQLERALAERATLVSIMAVNNETGVIQDLRTIGEMCHDREIALHSDIVQGLGRLPLDLKDLNVSFASLTAHKIYGPKGVGALYVAAEQRARLSPLCFGGGQEGGVRPGTLPTPLCVGLGEACRLASRRLAADHQRIAQLRDAFLQTLRNEITDVTVNGSLEHRVPANLNLQLSGIDSQSLMEQSPGVAISAGSACGHGEPSPVLRAMGLSRAQAAASIRISFGDANSVAVVQDAARQIAASVRKMRATALM